MFVPVLQPELGRDSGYSEHQPRADAVVQRLRPAAVGTYTTAPGYAQMYGLTVAGPTRNIRQTLSFRDDFSKIHGTHAFKMGYEILHFHGQLLPAGPAQRRLPVR